MPPDKISRSRARIHRRVTSGKRGRGFALVVTMVVMVLVVVMVLGMLSLSAVSRRTHLQSRLGVEARANARMSMAIAIGELQRSAGPDQRVTATANIGGSAVGNVLTANVPPGNDVSVNGVKKGLDAVKPGTRHWTGVFANTDNPADSFTKTPSPAVVRWLVSGNEIMPAGATGITPSTGSVNLNANGSVANPDTAALMVGAGSVGTGAANLDNFVAVPMVDIRFATGAPRQTSGRYAWWVGDDGVKAKFNIEPPYVRNTVATYPVIPAQRRGWETVTGWQKYPLPGDATAANLRKVLTHRNSALVDPSFVTMTSGASPPQRAFHGLTTGSSGVLADTLNGGLRIDLTAVLSKVLPDSANSYDAAVRGVPNLPVRNANIMPARGGMDYSPAEGPKWDRLRQFIIDGTAAKANGRLETRASTTFGEDAIAPLVSEIRFLLGMRLEPVAAVPTQYNTWSCAKIAVVLANPYAYPLRWTRDLDMEITVPYYGNPADARDLPYPAADSPARIWSQQNITAAYLANPNGNEPAVLRNVRFRIAANQEIPAGEARAYTMAAKFERPVDDLAERIVPLVPWVPAVLPDDFMVSLQMREDAPVDYAAAKSCDVRESWTTTLVNVTMRHGGASGTDGILRHIAGFELDNAPFGPTIRNITAALAESNTAPNRSRNWAIPLQLYSFQFSRPGEQYDQWLPANDMGARSSTVRTYADFNVQATRIRKTLMAYNPMPYFMEIANSQAYLPFDGNNNSCGSAFTRNLWLSPLPWGRAANGPPKTILFTRMADPSSLAHFQHADLTADDIYGSVGHQPGNAFGNSYASMFLKRELTRQSRHDYRIDGIGSTSTFTGFPRNYYDISHLLNSAIWDTYFLSTVAATGGTEPLNRMLVRRVAGDTSPELRDPAKAAKRLMIDGAFNINSTDKDAWKTLLAGTKFLKLTADGATAAQESIFPRSLEQAAAGGSTQTGTDADSFAGYRRLTDAQLNTLATAIVRQVRLRGPFVSLGHFVNRALVPLDRDRASSAIEPARSEDLGRAGALQAAIDYSNLTISPTTGSTRFLSLDVATDRVTMLTDTLNPDRPRADLGGSRALAYAAADTYPWPGVSTDLNPGTVAGSPADRPMLLEDRYRAEQGYRSTGIPGWLTQADVLQVIGPVIAARSDTFTIRGYGECGAAGTGKPAAKAWCEAVVQRVPDYIDPANSPIQRDPADQNQPRVLTAPNQRFGRQFQVISFRWLSPNEI